MLAGKARPLGDLNLGPARQRDAEHTILDRYNLAEGQGTVPFKNGLTFSVEADEARGRIADECKARRLRQADVSDHLDAALWLRLLGLPGFKELRWGQEECKAAPEGTYPLQHPAVPWDLFSGREDSVTHDRTRYRVAARKATLVPRPRQVTGIANPRIGDHMNRNAHPMTGINPARVMARRVSESAMRLATGGLIR